MAKQLVQFAESNSVYHIIRPTDETSREIDKNIEIPTLFVSGQKLADHLPWLYDFYRGPGLAMMQEFYGKERLICASNLNYAVNVQSAYDIDDRGVPMRYECHVDWAPTALLYATTHLPGEGGELVVANNPELLGQSLEDDCVRIHPRVGQLVCIDAPRYPHYVQPLKPSIASDNKRPFRVVVVFLYCTDENGSCPESLRPHALDKHLGHV